jgi:hypothetical protein
MKAQDALSRRERRRAAYAAANPPSPEARYFDATNDLERLLHGYLPGKPAAARSEPITFKQSLSVSRVVVRFQPQRCDQCHTTLLAWAGVWRRTDREGATTYEAIRGGAVEGTEQMEPLHVPMCHTCLGA